VTNKRFDDFVDEQRKRGTSLDAAARLLQWKADIADFFQLVEGFLKPYIESDKIKLSRRKTDVIEDFLGEYAVENIEIFIGPAQVNLKPIGAIIVGARGRIDMVGPDERTIMFILVNEKATKPAIPVQIYREGEKPSAKVDPAESGKWVWKIATKPPMQFLPLTEESFLDALMEVTNG